MQNFCRCFLFLLLVQALFVPVMHAVDNPFYIPVDLSGPSSEEKYSLLQQELQKLSMVPTLDHLYPASGEYIGYGGFLYRTSVGIQAHLLADEPFVDGKRTQVIFEKIGKGSDRCIVTYATFNHPCVKTIKNIAKALEETGFNGYFLAFLGGYSNPTGKNFSLLHSLSQTTTHRQKICSARGLFLSPCARLV